MFRALPFLATPALLAFAAGCMVLQTLPRLPAPVLLAGMLIAALALALVALRLRQRVGRGAAAVCSALLLGGCWAAWRADVRLADALPQALEGRDIAITGTIKGLPDRISRGQRFEMRVEQVHTAGAHVPAHIGLAWYAGQSDGIALPEPLPGERWQLLVRLRRPHGNANPHGFDVEAWLLQQGIRAAGYVRPAGSYNRRLDAFVLTFDHLVQRGRALLRARIEAALAGDPYAGVIVALVVGDQRAIDASDWQVFARTGVSHLISISGLHVTMLAGAAAGLAMLAWRAWVRRTGRLPAGLAAQRLAALVGALVALLYCLLAGMAVPAQRTLLMLTVVALALFLGRPVRAGRVLAVALFVVVLLDPWAVLAAGFWLSFGAVALIFHVTAGRVAVVQRAVTDDDAAPARWRERWSTSLGSAARTQWAMTIGLVPLTLLLFQQVSVVSPLANALAIPVVSFLVTPLALAGALLPGLVGDALLWLAHAVMAALAGVLGCLAAPAWAVWPAPVAPLWTVVPGLAGVCWMLAPRGWPVRGLGGLALLPGLLWPAARPAPGHLWLTILDVGQGSAVLVETRRHRLLYDTGPIYSPQADGGSRVVLPYLRARGIGQLDGLVVSHRDSDHSGGALSILGAVPVGWVASSLTAGDALMRRAPLAVRCAAGQSWQADGFRFVFLHPAAASHDEVRRKPNSLSCVLRIDAPGRPDLGAVLLTGDIEKGDEAELLARAGADGARARYLLVPHHGSLTSSTPAFIDAVRPDYAFVQAGYLNRFGHPRPAVLERYEQAGVRVLRTDRDGAIRVDIGGAAPLLRTWRDEHARYWYGR